MGTEPRFLAEESERTGWGIRSTFTTPDGYWWGREKGALLRFHEGAWTQVGAFPEACEYCRLRFVGGKGATWLLRDERADALWALDVEEDGGTARLQPVMAGTDQRSVFAALPLENGRFLLATDAGLKELDLEDAKIIPAEHPAPSSLVKALGRDESGRVWLAGDGVWVLDRVGSEIRDVTPPLLFPGSQVTLLAANPRDPEGVILSLGTRGVVFLRAKQE